MGAGNAEAAQRIQAIVARKHRDAQYRDYQEYRAEQHACGYEVESFEEWLGETSPRTLAEERMGLDAHRSLSDQCYYGDVY